ncbi:chemotaxis protein CheB [Mucilaginibacter terrenus]|uniref:protein-glutamate methylesterase n=1 Tax=Mucilaginibacter terrenus TaxID=2482727 RepID=A0A3E2NK16_9SPHI|nr:chemotaxis protein CheB [Mucilaginibacter terrenus]RFZ81344.1 chemotaxis protein CheB [Mucilaginibacter terrenus]
MEPQRIVVVGTSAGGIKAVNQLMKKFPADLPVAIFVVIHMSKHSQAHVIKEQLQKSTAFTCRVPTDGEQIQAGHLYISPADVHMLVKPGEVRLVLGPHENRWRPSIDVLFRSAAVAYGAATIGIILTGLLDDGTSGLAAIKRSGGMAIVQDPAEAEYDDMPVSAISNVEIDNQVFLEDMGYIVADMVAKPVKTLPIPEDVKIEADITERMASKITDMEKIGTHSNFTCPDCGGGLWRIKNDNFPRYRCHTGHVYTEAALMQRQAENMEESIWVSIRMLEERRNLLLGIVWREENENTGKQYAEYKVRAEELSIHIERLKGLLISMTRTESDDEGHL